MSDRRLFAISDPHLSTVHPKPMGVFGPAWASHPAPFAEHWRQTVGRDDIVLVPGDISWAMRLDEAKPDLEWLAELPGEKVFIKGNHDYWWQSIGRVRALGLAGMHFLQSGHLMLDGVAIGGTRLWDFPEVNWPIAPADLEAETPAKKPAAHHSSLDSREGDPEKIRARELGRLEASLAGMPREARLRVAMTHFPPVGENGEPTGITDLISSFDIDFCVFGHIHAPASQRRPGEDVTIGKTRYILVSCDFLGMKPKEVAELDG